MLRMLLSAREFQESRRDDAIGPIAQRRQASRMHRRICIAIGFFGGRKRRRSADASKRWYELDAILRIKFFHRHQKWLGPVVRLTDAMANGGDRPLGGGTFASRFRLEHTRNHRGNVLGSSDAAQGNHGGGADLGIVVDCRYQQLALSGVALRENVDECNALRCRPTLHLSDNRR